MPLTIYKRGKIWHYRGTVAGRKLRGTTRTTEKRTAQRLAAEQEAKHWKSHFDGPASVLTFVDAAHLYLDAGKPSRFLGRLTDYWEETPVQSMTAGAIRQSAIDLYPNVSNATRNRSVLIPTQAVINHVAEQGLCQRLRVKKFPTETREKEPATWEWIQAFMAEASPHMGALACFMFLTGARISEAISLTWEDVDFKRSRALIRQTKVGSERWAHLPGPLFSAIANIQNRKERVFKLTVPPEGPWRRTAERAGIKPLSFHSCRHGFATAMLHAGVDPVTTAKLGGWKSPQHVFSTYGHAMDDETVTERILGTPGAQSKTQSRNKEFDQ